MNRLLKERYQVKCLVIGYDHRFGHNRSEEDSRTMYATGKKLV